MFSLMSLHLILKFRLCFQRLLKHFNRQVIQYCIKGGPVICFLFAKNQLIIESDLEAPNIGKKHVFFTNRVVILVFLLLNRQKMIGDFVSSNDRRMLFEDILNKIFNQNEYRDTFDVSLMIFSLIMMSVPVVRLTFSAILNMNHILLYYIWLFTLHFFHSFL